MNKKHQNTFTQPLVTHDDGKMTVRRRHQQIMVVSTFAENNKYN